MNNPCAEIPLDDFAFCQLAMLLDDMPNAAFAECVGNNKAWKTKKKKKKLWRSIFDDWTPTKPELK
jgi:general stress protein 26